MEMPNISFSNGLLVWVSSFVIFSFGRKKSNIIIDVPSLIIFIRTTVVTAATREYFIIYDTIVIVRISLVNCSIMLDMVIGKTFSLPKKYPLIILDTAIKGSVVPIASNG
mgnify:FL=1